MTWATHTIIGSGVAALLPHHPAAAFGAVIASHFLLDTIPHWDYKLRSLHIDKENPLNSDIKIGRDFIVDLAHIFADTLIGILGAALVLHYILHQPLFPALIIGAAGGILPDALQFAYMKIRREPLTSLQVFHTWVQKGRHLLIHPVLGILLQATVIVIAVLIIRIFAF